MNHSCPIARVLFAIFLLYACLNCIGKKTSLVYSQTIHHSSSAVGKQTFSNQSDYFYGQMMKLPELKSKHIFKKYKPVIARELDMERLYFTSYQELKNLLDLAVKESIDVLTLFTLPVLQNKKNKALVLDKKILLKLNDHYNLHGLFLILTHSADDASDVQMDFLVTGQGKLIVGYDKNITIEHPDYFFATGKYDYQRIFVMDAKADDKGNRGLFNIKGLSSPTGKFRWMKGPLNVDIKSLSLISEFENKKKVLVQYDLLGARKKVITRIPIEKLSKKN